MMELRSGQKTDTPQHHKMRTLSDRGFDFSSEVETL
jgi:hypothetical protein